MHTIRSTTWDAMTWPLVREQIPGGANLRAALVALRIKQDEPELRFVHRRGVAPRHACCFRAAS